MAIQDDYLRLYHSCCLYCPYLIPQIFPSAYNIINQDGSMKHIRWTGFREQSWQRLSDFCRKGRIAIGLIYLQCSVLMEKPCER